MLWMAAVHSKVLMCVRGLDMQVSANLAVLQVDYSDKEDHFLADHEAVNVVDVFYDDSKGLFIMVLYG